MTAVNKRQRAGWWRCVAIHEGGHACVAVKLRIGFRSVHIFDGPDGGARGFVSGRRTKLKIDLSDARYRDFLERQIVVDFAGGMAQRRYTGNSNWEYGMGHNGIERVPDLCYDIIPPNTYTDRVKTEPDSDLDNINKRLNYLGRHGDDAYRAELEARAFALVKELWPEIKIVAAALLKHKVLSAAEVRRLMKRARRQ
jgi:hypothetical protein